jgi:hypothetical protein
MDGISEERVVAVREPDEAGVLSLGLLLEVEPSGW